MENINPTIRLLLSVKLALERGESLRQGLRTYLLQGYGGDLPVLVAELLALKDQGLSITHLKHSLQSPYQRSLIDIIERGLMGEAILPTLASLEPEIFQACMDELDQSTILLPMKALIPLLLFQFPAIAILFLSPLFAQLFKSI